MNDQTVTLLRQRRFVAMQQHAAMRGMFLSGMLAMLVLSGALPLAAGAQAALLFLAGMFGISRLARGLWAAQAAQVLAARLSQPQPDEDPNQRAVRLLTEERDDPLLERVRAHGLDLAQRLRRLRPLLSDRALAPALRRPVAEEVAHLEAELASLLGVAGAIGREGRNQHQDFLPQLSARLEVERPVPAGLYAAAR